MSSKAEILSRLQKTQSGMPPVEKRRREYTDLSAQFSASLNAAKGEVYRVETLERAVQKLADLFEELQINSVAANLETPLTDLGLAGAFPSQKWFFAGQEVDYRSVCPTVDAGLTSAEFALAETGSLVLVSGPYQSRLTSLLPPIHLVLLPESRILPGIFDWVARRPEEFPSNIVLVSGPSKTADIEQTLVVGVHGPKRLIVIVYPDVP